MQWLLTILQDLDLKQALPIVIYEDKISCIKLSKNDKHQARTKHIHFKFPNVKHTRENGAISLHYCPSKLMTANVLTKTLPKPQFETLRAQLQLSTPRLSDRKQGCRRKKNNLLFMYSIRKINITQESELKIGCS